MASSYISSFLRQQGLENEKGLSRQKVFVEQAASELLGQVAQMNQMRGTKRRGMRAAAESAGEDARANVEIGRTRLEAEKDIAEEQQVLSWITAASGAAGTLMAYYADELEKDAKKEKEAASIAESQATEEAARVAEIDEENDFFDELIRDEARDEARVQAKAEEVRVIESRRVVESQNRKRGRAGFHDRAPVGIEDTPEGMAVGESYSPIMSDEEKRRKSKIRKLLKRTAPERAMMIGDAE